MSDPAATRIVVLGGGVTGLAAAHRLVELAAERGEAIDVRLLEASDRVGGVIRTVRRDGYLLELGPDNFITNKPHALDLCRRLGLTDQLLPTNDEHRRAMVVRRGRLVPIPEGFELMMPRRLWPVLTSPIFSPLGKLRMICEPFIPRRRGGNGEADDESLASFVTRRLGREALDRLVQPLVGGIYTADPQTLSVRATVPRFLEWEQQHGSLALAARAQRRQRIEKERRERERESQGNESGAASKLPRADGEDADGGTGETRATGARYSLFVALREGMQTLTEALAHKLGERITTNARVQAIQAGNGDSAWRILMNDGEHLDADGVIAAPPSYHAADWLRGFDGELSTMLSQIEYASSAVVVFGFERSQVGHPLDAFGFVAPATEGRAIIAGAFSSVKYAGRAPADGVVLRAFLGGATQTDALAGDDEALIATARRELGDLLDITGEPRFAELRRYDRAMPQYKVGHLSRVAAIRERCAAHRGLELAGNAYDGVGIPDCIASAEQAADRLLATLLGDALRAER